MLAAFLLTLALSTPAPARPELDVTRYPVVLRHSGMERVLVKRDVPLDGELRMDLYLPAGGGRWPAVVFANGIGPTRIRDWAIYQTWARLVAAHGMAGVLIDARPGGGGAALATAAATLKREGAALGVDGEHLAVWSCSANVSPALPWLMDGAPPEVRAAVVYYGSAPLRRVRTDLPLLWVLAGRDGPQLLEGERAAWGLAVAHGAPWTMVNAPDLAHAFDALDPSEESRRTVKLTVDWLAARLGAAPPSSGFDPPGREALLAGYAQDWKAAADGFRGLVDRTPEAWPQLARALLLSGDHAGAAAAYEEAFARGAVPERTRPVSLYNLGCAYARLGRKDEAFDRLRRAAEAGFGERAQYERDPDLDALRGDPRWKALVERTR